MTSPSKSLAFFRPLDAGLIALVIAAACWGFFTFRFSEGTRAVVYVANIKFAWYELSGDKRRITIPTQIGTVYLEIGGGMARVVASPCPGQICVKTGIIRHAHEEVACVPAQLLLILEGPAGPDPQSKGADAITF